MKNSVLCYLEETIQKYSDKIAYCDANAEISFKELRERAIDIAFKIKEQLEGRRNPILTFLPKSTENILAFMGILYSGNFYTPTDIRFPAKKIKSVADALQPSLVLVNTETREKLLEIIPDANVINIDEIPKYGHYEDGSRLVADILDVDPVYTLFTSGSTGVPKGVTICNRSIIDYIDWAKRCYHISSRNTLGNQAPLYFDNSTLDVYLALATGATLILIPENFYAFPAKLMQYVVEKQINTIFWVPSVFISVANANILEKIDCTCLHTILFAGEVMPNKHLNYWRRYIPNALFSNLYGPTEITVDCTYYIVDREFSDNEPLPIGIPCRNSDVLILSDEGKEIKEHNKIGELCVRGSSLALGYWRDLERTNEKFVQNPLHNNYPERIYKTGDLVYLNERDEIMFAGRKDFQIKHMGYRIELGEIENAAISIPEINNACAVYDMEKKEIILCIETPKENFDGKEIRKMLIGILPKYMVPTQYIQYESLPLNDNGKIDRSLLLKEYQKAENQ